MCPKCHNFLCRLHAIRKDGIFITQAQHLDRTKRNGRGLRVQRPHTRPIARSITEAIGTFEGSEVCVPAGSSIVTVAPSGAFASTPSRTYRASKVRVSESAASESCLKRAGTLAVSPYSVARTIEPRAGRIVSGR